MECLIGIKGKNFVVMSTDSIAGRSIVAMKQDHDKTYQLSRRLLMAISGEGGDPVQFAEYIAKNIQLYRMRNGYDLSVKEAASFTRHNLADSIRSSTPYSVNLLVGGYDDVDGTSLYYMDYLGSSADVEYGVHGYGSFFALSILDRYYKPDLTVEEAIQLMQKCVNEIATRFIVNMGGFRVKIITATGIREHTEVLRPQSTDGGQGKPAGAPAGRFTVPLEIIRMEH